MACFLPKSAGCCAKRLLGSLLWVLAGVWQFGWILDGWANSPLDRRGWYFVLAAFAALCAGVYPARNLVEKPDRRGLWFLLPAIAGLLISTVLGIRLSYYLCWIISGLGIAWIGWGWRFALWLSPIFGVLALGIPVTGYLLKLLSMDVPALYHLSVFVIQCTLAVVLLAIFFVATLSMVRTGRGWITPSQAGFAVMTLVVFGFLVSRISFSTFRSSYLPFPPESLQTATWAGSEIPLTSTEQNGFEGKSMEKYKFFDRSGQMLTLTILYAGDAPRSLHPPEYCLLGSGWSVGNRNVEEFSAHENEFEVSSLVASRGHDKLFGVYWFSSSSESTPSHAAFRKSSRSCEEHGWHLFFLTTPMSPDIEDSRIRLQSFLTELPQSSQIILTKHEP